MSDLTKIDKILLVRRLRLNTETNIVIQSHSHSELLKLHNFIKLHDIDEVSIRTQAADGSRNTPHYPIVKAEDAFEVVTDLIIKGYYAIVATPINPKDAVLAGAVLKEGPIFTIELAIGPHTVRRVTHEGLIDITAKYDIRSKEIYNCNKINPYYIVAITEILNECKKIPLRECIAEVSYYRKEVGYLNKNVIIWDIDSSGTQESTMELESFYYDIPQL